MRDGEQTLDVVVRGEDGLALNLSAARLAEDRLNLVGVLIDREIPFPVNVAIEAAYAPEFVEGAHVRRASEWLFVADETEISFGWEVETHDLPNGFALQDAQVWSDQQDVRAFAIEDLAATVGIGLGVAVGAFLYWRHEKVRVEERERAEALWRRCLEAGGKPSWHVSVEGEASLGSNGLPKFTSRTNFDVDCN
jgi:hypothetical protein